MATPGPPWAPAFPPIEWAASASSFNPPTRPSCTRSLRSGTRRGPTTAPPGAALSGNLHGLYRLDTTDGTWRLVTGVPNTLFGTSPTTRCSQGLYDNAVEVDPTNVNRVFVGGSTQSSSGEWSGSLHRCAVTLAEQCRRRRRPTSVPRFMPTSIGSGSRPVRRQQPVGRRPDGGVFHSANPRAPATSSVNATPGSTR